MYFTIPLTERCSLTANDFISSNSLEETLKWMVWSPGLLLL